MMWALHCDICDVEVPAPNALHEAHKTPDGYSKFTCMLTDERVLHCRPSAKYAAAFPRMASTSPHSVAASLTPIAVLSP